MNYAKAYWNAFSYGLMGFGSAYLVLNVIALSPGAWLCLYYAATVGCAGAIDEFLNQPKEDKKNA